MDWKDIVIQIIIPIGLGQIFFRWMYGVILCRYNLQRRKSEIRTIINKIKTCRLEDFSRRGLAQSGMRAAAVSDLDSRNKELIQRLNTLHWFGNDVESERIIDDLKNELRLTDSALDQKYFYYRFYDTFQEIKVILSNSELLESVLTKKLKSYKDK